MTRPPCIEAATFDFDGLMFNTETLYEEIAIELLRRRGEKITQDLLQQMMGRPSHIALQIMIDWYRLDTSVEQLQHETDSIFDQLLADRLAPMPGLMELLAKLEVAKIPKAIATSSRRQFVDRVLALADMVGRFQFIVTPADVKNGKPHPDVYLTAARQFHMPPERMLVLEDSEVGCRAAVAAGTYTVAVPGNHSCTHDFTGAVFVAESLGDRRIYQALGLD